ncbi:MAG: Dihydrofolate reductase [Candidatus Roizmanbacteria bacterium GW2011_GWC2_37_13]|uniref:Dihydrofolate reductase n=1 Tax=Candidatus Roizmanbacteria bacterium GW2011_GWC2_37_13 TaxID=1618486 RepID=A0A0G0GFR9_9BACT|nr:MAG: dihydrofolate reductase, dihydrofolate reductase [Candidatus Roizmanbacteria bacterium GW2011_GWC1_37_12]KKQ24890.1 MAG: Dihydrofolate reductase [Candidatus Roizmanbacteria bacterium GW2011_GWC2_37_13]
MKTNPIISMIAAMDENRGIGYQGRIPWHIREDLLRFKHLTTGKTVIFGRKTYESLLGYYQRSGRPMPERKTIVVSRTIGSNETHGIHWANSIEEALVLARKIEPEEVFISGGAQIFSQGIKYAEKLYLTIVKGKFQADAFFPDYSDFKVIKEEKKSYEKYFFKFIELIK